LKLSVKACRIVGEKKSPSAVNSFGFFLRSFAREEKSGEDRGEETLTVMNLNLVQGCPKEQKTTSGRGERKLGTRKPRKQVKFSDQIFVN
jgi:hypothetical protein